MAVEICNRGANVSERFNYRHTSAGKLVPLTKTQLDSISEDSTANVDVNENLNSNTPPPKKGGDGAEISASDMRHRITEMNELKKDLLIQISQLTALATPTREMLKQNPKDGLDKLDQIRKILRVKGHPMTRFLLGELKYVYLKTLRIYEIQKLYHDFTSLRIEKGMTSTERRILLEDKAAIKAKLEAIRVEIDEAADKEAPEMDYPAWMDMYEYIVNTNLAIYNRTTEEWEGDIREREDYLVAVQEELNQLEEKEAEVHLIDIGTIPLPKALKWADEVINIPDRSREMTQLERRIDQSRNGKAIYYFGVEDDGTIVNQNRTRDVSRFVVHFLMEMKDEGYYSHEVEFLSEEQFLIEQETFPQREEIETGPVEYKSTGGHIEDLPPPPNNIPEFRVIKLIIKRAVNIAIRDSQLFLKEPGPQGPPVYNMVGKEIQEPIGILRVSRWRKPCYREPGFRNLPERRQKELRAEDNALRESAIALSRTLSAVTTGLVMARQEVKGGLKALKMPQDLPLYQAIHEIQKKIIIDWNESGHEPTATKLKEATSQLRLIWQTNRADNINDYCVLFIKFLDLTTPKINNTAVPIWLSGVEYSPPAYGLCVLGTLGRALPPPPREKATKEMFETFERFREPTNISPELEKEVRDWAYTFFKDMPRPDSLKLAPAGAGGCLERPRSKGGIGALVSDYYQLLKGIQDPASFFMYNICTWQEKWKGTPALYPGNVAAHQDRAGEFAYALALDLCQEHIKHYEKCVGADCQEKEKHFPLIPFGIPERGHKTRVPCLGSGFLNILQQPIRKAMFQQVKKDRRCAYRAKGGTKRASLDGFLRSFERNMLSHAGDLRVSTDNFSHKFNEALAWGILDTGKISETEFAILRASTGAFRMIEPSDESVDQLHDLQPQAFHLICKKKAEDPMEIDPKFRTLLYRMSNKPKVTAAKEDSRREWPWINNIKPRHTSPRILVNDVRNCINCEKYIQFCTCNKGPFLIQVEKKEGFKLNSTEGWVKAGRGGPEGPPSILQPTQGEGIGYQRTEPLNYEWDHVELLYGYTRAQTNILQMPGSSNYLTKRGVQMSQALSIATLYSYNLFADDKSRQLGGKGMSLLCGDDSLRTGDQLFIMAYRETIEKLGGEWSKTKDVVGTTGNGIFTEQHFSFGTIHDIPKIKAVARYDSDNIPGWCKAIQAFSKVEFPVGSEPNQVAAQGRQLVLAPYLADINEVKQFLPIGLPVTLGGIGSNDPIHWKTEEALRRLPNVTDKTLASKCLKRVLKCLHPDPISTKRQWKIDLSVDYPSEKTSALEREIGFHKGTYRWIYLERQSLRAAMEAAVALENPSYPVKFEKRTNYRIVRDHMYRLDQVLDKLTDVPNGDINIPKLIHKCFQYDVPTSIVKNIIGTVVSDHSRYQMFE